MNAVDALVLGVGNPFRRDDGAGPAVVQHLAGRAPAGVRLEVLPGGASEVLAALESAERIFLVDATGAAGSPGALRRFDAAAGPVPASLSSLSSHGPGVAEAVELARLLGRLPARLDVYGIEGADFGHGEGLSATVEATVGRVAETVLAELTAPPPAC